MRMPNKLARLLLSLVALGAIASSQAGPAQAPVDTPRPGRDGSHDMDFSLGTWRTDITSFRDPLTHPGEAAHMSGTKTVRPVWGGKAVLEEIEADGPSGHWEAANLFLYDPNAHQWSQNYTDSETGRFDGPPAIGEYRDGDLEFHWQATINGRATLVRGIWTGFTPNSHIYRVQRSSDGGRSWHTSFEARLTKIQ
jgi:hypothetical protein